MKTSRPGRTAALASFALVFAVGGCASILGDFSVSETAAPHTDGGGDLEGGPIVDSGAEGDVAAPGGDATTEAGLDANAPPDDAGGSDAADTGAGSDAADAAPWTPTVLDQAGELAFWLEASSANLVVSNSTVEAWNDLSQNKNNASNPAGGPTLSAAAIAGHDALNFASDNVTLAMTDATSLQFAEDQVYITAVARVRSGSPYFFGKYTTTASGGGAVYATGLLFFAASSTLEEGGTILGPVARVDSQSGDEVDWDGAGGGFQDGNFHIVAMRRTSASSLSLAMDDGAAESEGIGEFSVSAAGEPAYVGSVQFGSFRAATNFDIAEIVAVHSSTGIVADADVAKLHAYLKQKYGL